jgi:hypothetical protein
MSHGGTGTAAGVLDMTALRGRCFVGISRVLERGMRSTAFMRCMHFGLKQVNGVKMLQVRGINSFYYWNGRWSRPQSPQTLPNKEGQS